MALIPTSSEADLDPFGADSDSYFGGSGAQGQHPFRTSSFSAPVGQERFPHPGFEPPTSGPRELGHTHFTNQGPGPQRGMLLRSGRRTLPLSTTGTSRTPFTSIEVPQLQFVGDTNVTGLIQWGLQPFPMMVTPYLSSSGCTGGAAHLPYWGVEPTTSSSMVQSPGGPIGLLASPMRSLIPAHFNVNDTPRDWEGVFTGSHGDTRPSEASMSQPVDIDLRHHMPGIEDHMPGIEGPRDIDEIRKKTCQTLRHAFKSVREGAGVHPVN